MIKSVGPLTVCVFQPACTIAALLLYLFTVAIPNSINMYYQDS